MIPFIPITMRNLLSLREAANYALAFPTPERAVFALAPTAQAVGAITEGLPSAPEYILANPAFRPFTSFDQILRIPSGFIRHGCAICSSTT
jgi:hypothetical protein